MINHNITNSNLRIFWENQLADVTDITQLPYDVSNLNDNFLIETKIVNSEIKDKILSICNNSDPQIYVFFLASYFILVNKFTSINDITILTPIVNLNNEDCIINNILLLRNRIEQQITFKEHLLNIQKLIVSVNKHQNYPIINALKTDNSETIRLPSDVIFTFNKIHNSQDIISLSGNLKLNLIYNGNDLLIQLNFNTKFYSDSFGKRLLVYFERLLLQIVGNINIHLEDIYLLNGQDYNELVYNYNNTKSELSGNSVLEIFKSQVKLNSNRVAIQDFATGMHLTYSELDIESNRIANFLLSKNVKPNSTIGLLLSHSSQLIVYVLGVIKSGSAFILLDTSLPEERIIRIIRDVNMSYVFIDNDEHFQYLVSIIDRSDNIKPLFTAKREPICDLDSLPIPDRSYVNYEKYNNYIGHAAIQHSMTLQATRGCPYLCAYCHRIWPKKHTRRSPNHIYDEVSKLYDIGVKRFSFIDDIFNLNRKESTEFFEKIIKNNLGIKFFFPNGLRGDILTKDYVDLMVESGLGGLALALETNSLRIQKLIGKNLILDKFDDIVDYFCSKYPNVILELFTMLGFPSETKEEANSTLNFIKAHKWIDFPYINLLKIYPNTDLMDIALSKGINKAEILKSVDLAHHEYSPLLPFDSNFVLQYQSDYLNNYFLSNERLKQKLPHQLKLLSENEIIQKYNSYLGWEAKNLHDLFLKLGVDTKDIQQKAVNEEFYKIKELNRKLKEIFPKNLPNNNSLKLLFIDISQEFEINHERLGDLLEPPLGLMYLAATLNSYLKEKVNIKIIKPVIDYNNFDELKELINDFNPNIIGCRSIIYYKKIFHKTISKIKSWYEKIPIIAGGPYISSNADIALQDVNIDLAILGEGEMSILELVSKIIENGNKIPADNELERISGLVFYKKEIKDQLNIPVFFNVNDVKNSGIVENSDMPNIVKKKDDPEYILFTSGSTGYPKGVTIGSEALYNYINWANKHYTNSTKPIMPFYTSISFDLTLTSIFLPICCGGKMVIFKDDLIDDIFKNIDKCNSNNLIKLTPSHLKLLISRKDCLKTFKNFIVGGELLTTNLINDFVQKYGDQIKIYNEYGPTEATVGCMTYLTDNNNTLSTSVPIGRPIDNTRIFVLDESYKPVPIGVNGEIYIEGTGLSNGYLNNIEETYSRFIRLQIAENCLCYRTGDRARFISTDNVEFISRISKEQVKVNGVRVEMKEIEMTTLRHPQINQCVCLCKYDKYDNSRLLLYYTSESQLTSEIVRDFLKNHLPEYILPTHYINVHEMPLTSNGKIDVSALPDIDTMETHDYIKPENVTEEIILGFWSDILDININQISVTADFFKLGAHSINAFMLISRINKYFNSDISLTELFTNSTVKKLSQLVLGKRKHAENIILKAPKRNYYPVSSAQKRLFAINQLLPESLQYNIPFIVELEGKVDIQKFQSIFNQIVARHEVFRTKFEFIEDDVIQIIESHVDFKIEELKVKSINELLHDFIRPFELDKAPLIRIAIATVSKNKYFFLMDLHHIISDGITHHILIREFSMLYNNIQLPELKLQYKDYAYNQFIRKQNKENSKSETFWHNEYSTDFSLINLPTDYSRDSDISFEGSFIEFEFDTAVTKSLIKIADEHSCTMFMVLLSAFYVLLAKLSNQKDIIIGVPVSGRNYQELEQIAGNFINTLPIRVSPDNKLGFEELLKYVKTKALQAFDNQDYQIEDLIDYLKLERITNRNPLFDVIFLYQNIDIKIPEIEKNVIHGLSIKPIDIEYNTAKVDLKLTAEVINNKIKLSFNYKIGLFTKDTILEFVEKFKVIIKAVIDNSNVKIEHIQVTDDLYIKNVLSSALENLD